MLTRGTRIPNTLQSNLSEQGARNVAPLLSRQWLPADSRLMGIEERLDWVWFPESAIISVSIEGGPERGCCVGLYGFEGCGSAAAVLGAPTSLCEEFVQRAGWAYRIKSQDLHFVLATLQELRRILNGYVHTFLMQVSDASLAVDSRIEQRLARLLLMLHDRTCENALALTHQRLSDMLNVRRAGITDAMHILEGERLIRAQRGLIQIIDRRCLAARAGAIYGKPEAEYGRLILESLPSDE
jgi:hypothetical protein